MQEQIMDTVSLGDYVQSHFHGKVLVQESGGTITLTQTEGRRTVQRNSPRSYSKAEKIAAAQALIGILPPDIDLDASREERLSK
jgi:hypothetical protein